MWINATDCTFENNGIGLHWNSTDATATDSHYTGNIFRGNDTAVLLEQVPTDTVLNFGQCVFEHNETDLDNPLQPAGGSFGSEVWVKKKGRLIA